MKRALPSVPRAGRGAAALIGSATLALLLGGSALVAQQTPPKDSDQDALATRVDKLEKALAAANVQVRGLTDELGKTEALLDQTVRYLQDQSKSAAQLAQALDQVEQLGFTYGINPKSREALLAGWRERLSAERAGVPGAREKADQEGEAGEGEGAGG